MRLSKAYLCLDCSEIFEWRGSWSGCPVCGSRAFHPVSGWISTYEAIGRLSIMVDDNKVVPLKTANKKRR